MSSSQRVINAWDWEAQDQLIADAMVIIDTKDTHCDRLLVFSCAMEKFEVSFGELPALQSIPQEERTKFTIAEDGSYLYWEKPDIHLDLDTLRCAVNRAWKQKFDIQKLIHNQLFGQAIAVLRKQYKLRQSDIIGLSERQVSRIEKGQGTKLETLALFAKAHGMELNDYLEAVANLIPDVPDEAISSFHKESSEDKLPLKDELRRIMGNETVEVIKEQSDSDCRSLGE